jgi:hypothetical protein
MMIEAKGPPGFLIVIATLQVLVFCAALYFVWKIWMIVLAFLRDADPEKAKLLAIILGEASTQGKKGPASIKAVGIGLGVTILILLVAVGAIYVIGQHTVR